MKYHLITAAILIAAIGSLVLVPVVSGVLLGIAIVLEMVFWKRLISGSSK